MREEGETSTSNVGHRRGRYEVVIIKWPRIGMQSYGANYSHYKLTMSNHVVYEISQML